MFAIMFSVEGQPHGKGRPRFRRGGGFVSTYTDTKTRDYEARVAARAKIAMGETNPLQGALSVSITAIFETPKSWSKKKKALAIAGEIRPTVKPDIDNICKAVFDAMNNVVYADDKQIYSVRVEKKYASVGEVVISVSGEAAE